MQDANTCIKLCALELVNVCLLQGEHFLAGNILEHYGKGVFISLRLFMKLLVIYFPNDKTNLSCILNFTCIMECFPFNPFTHFGLLLYIKFLGQDSFNYRDITKDLSLRILSNDWACYNFEVFKKIHFGHVISTDEGFLCFRLWCFTGPTKNDMNITLTSLLQLK